MQAFRVGVISDYKPIRFFIWLLDRQLIIKIKDKGTRLLRIIIKQRSDYDQISLRDRHPGCQGGKNVWHAKVFSNSFSKHFRM